MQNLFFRSFALRNTFTNADMKTKYTADQIYDYLYMNGIATEKEIMLVIDINGKSVETMCDILYARTGYRSIEQLEDEEDGNN